MGRWVFVVTIILVHFLFLASYSPRQENGIPCAKNVVIIVVDTLAAQHLGFMGYDRDTSPFMDELASKSVVFTRAYTPKPTTLPAFTSLLSGVHPCHHGVFDNGVELPDNMHMLTEDFQSHDFRTWAIPAAQVIEGRFGLEKGFDFYSYPPGFPAVAKHQIDRVSRILTGNGWIGEPDYLSSGAPFFLMLHFYDVHTEYTPDDDILPIFADSTYNGIVDGTWEQFKRYNDYELEYNDADLEHVRDMYDAEIRSFDRHLSDLFDLFEQTGILDNSVIVITADHGENLGEHHYITHGQPYEGGLSIPLMVHFPLDRWAGMRISDLVETTDIVPTLMEAVNIGVPEGIDGQSLLPLIDGRINSAYHPRSYLYAIGHPTDTGRMYSIFDGTHRVTVDVDCFGNSEGPAELLVYDIPDDPHEALNIRGDDPDALNHLLPSLLIEIQGSHYGREQTVDPQTVEMLRSLGYIG
jgi:arylsulfatase A-like enzyme